MQRVRHFTNKMNRTKRTASDASLDSASRRLSFKERSKSEILDSPKAAPHINEYLLVYLGYAWVEESRSAKELQVGIKNVLANRLTQRSVSVTHQDGYLTVREISGDKLLDSPLHFIAQVTPDDIKGVGQFLAIGFLGGHYNNQCHVFKAKSNREVSQTAAVRVC